MNRRLLALLTPLFMYNHTRDAYVLRAVGRHVGPVLKRDRRERREGPIEGVEMRRRTGVTQRFA